MTARRDELHEIIDALPEDQVDVLLDDARRRVNRPSRETRAWPPSWFGAIDREDLPTDLARNHDTYLHESGFGTFR